MTPEQIDALPTRIRTRDITADDIAKGIMGRCVEFEDPRLVKVTRYKPDDPICYADTSGQLWTICEWEDGEKFKEPFFVF